MKRKKGKRKSEFYIKKAIYPLYAFEAQGICSFLFFKLKNFYFRDQYLTFFVLLLTSV